MIRAINGSTQSKGREAVALREISSVPVPAGQGAACTVQAGQYVRVVDVEGGQVADFNAWTLPDYKEQFWSGRTRIVEGAHLSTGNRLFSAPNMEVLFTITDDTVKRVDSPLGAISHDLIYARCSSGLWKLRGVDNAPNCQDNLVRAIESYGLTAHNVHDAFNIFMKTGIDKDDRLFEEPAESLAGDYLELRAEKDCLVAVSSCPGRGNRFPEWRNRPLRIDVLEEE